ncbi:MAG: HAD family hydrolase [Desulfovibrio sp.]|nr:HAD family hydrolase [Desulfovibrio sp.]
MALQCLVFDCDGVILDSVPVKTRAFARVAEPFGEEARDRLLMYHKVHGGVSRYKKFEWLYEHVLGKAITPEESRRLGNLFAEYVLDELQHCALIPGAQDVLTYWRGRLPMFVCSGTPQEELQSVLQLRRLDGYFDAIYGSPPAKAELLAHIVRTEKLDPADVLMVGDAPTDRDAADYAGTMFYGVGSILKGGDFPWGEDLTGLNAWIKEHL